MGTLGLKCRLVWDKVVFMIRKECIGFREWTNTQTTKFLLQRSCKQARDFNVLILYNGAEGARTPDLMTASHALSQLSYSPKAITNYKLRIANKQLIIFL